jgi:hypothetical protein
VQKRDNVIDSGESSKDHIVWGVGEAAMIISRGIQAKGHKIKRSLNFIFSVFESDMDVPLDVTALMQLFTQMTFELEALVVDPRQLLVGSEAHSLVINMRDELELAADVLPEELVACLDCDFARYLRQFHEQDTMHVIQHAFSESRVFAELTKKQKILWMLSTGFKMQEIEKALGTNKSGLYRYACD